MSNSSTTNRKPMAILKSPPKACCMCGSPKRAVLQYKVDNEPWQDAHWSKFSNSWQVTAQPSLMRWLCGTHWLQDKGHTEYKYQHPRYKRPRRRTNGASGRSR